MYESDLIRRQETVSMYLDRFTPLEIKQEYKRSYKFLTGFINYEKVSCYNYKKAYNLDRIKNLLSLLDNPQDRYPSVIISGTKGKGSTAAILGSILTSAGIKAGIFTSPHLVSAIERVRIGKRFIPRKDFLRGLSLIRSTIDKSGLKGLTYFEILTSLGFLYFARKKIDIAVLEVGLGGRLDATNVVCPLVSAITPIDYDHIHLLGDSIEKIAREKCGIIKKATYVISAPQSREAQRVIIKTARDKKARLLLVGKDITYKNLRISSSGADFDVKTPYSSYKDLNIPLIGRHQVINSLTALGIVEILKRQFGFDIDELNVRKGLKGVRLSGRFQIVSKRPYVVLDGAHNKASARGLKDAFESFFGKKRSTLILGISSDKDIEGIGKILSPLAESVIFTRAKSPRAEAPSVLAHKLGRFYKDYYVSYDIKDAFSFAKEIVDKNGIILITGSLFLVGDALKNIYKLG